MAGALTAAIAAAFSGSAVVSDPYFEYTTLLLPGNGTNGAQNNTFLDGSTNNFTITRNGNTTQGTFSPFSQTGWGNYFNGSSQYLSAASNAAFGVGSGDFTIELWVYLTANFDSNGKGLITAAYDTNFAVIGVNSGAGNKIDFYVANTLLSTGTNYIALNTWTHLALVRSSGTTKIYFDGVEKASSGSLTGTGAAAALYVGTLSHSTAYVMTGYLSNVRLVKGTAVYTSNFTPPTAPLTVISGTSLLTCQSNRFIDNSSNAFALTLSGSPTVVAFSPFNPTASWSAATYGGSGYFDGSGDYLSVADNAAFDFGSGDFTIECWAYTDTFASQYNVLVCQWDTSYSFVFRITSSLVGLYINVGSPFTLQDYTASVTNTTGQWNHFCVTRSGSTLTFYKNGASIGTSSISATITNSASNLTVGVIGDLNANTYHKGYISGMRLIKGTAVAPTITTPPTAVSGTSLLLNFTNAGIYDATSKNDLETVGNAQISTAISAKWGSGTIALDGNGDYLNIPSSQLNVFGTGDFTIEMWAYITDYTTGSPTFNDYGPFFDFRTANTSQVNVVLSFLSTFGGTGRPCMFINGAVTITGNVMTINSWTHIALSRVSGVTRMYMGGDQAGSNYTDTNNYTSTVCTIGVNIARDAFLKGYIQDPRITRGYGRYVTGTGGNAGKMVLNGTNTLALPTAAFPTL